MKNILIKISLQTLTALVLCLTLQGCGSPPAFAASPSATPTAIPECSLWVEQITALRATQAPPELARSDIPPNKISVPAGLFDPNQYFNVLTHLHMQAGFSLDYVFTSQGLAARPVLFARPLQKATYPTYGDYASEAVNAAQDSPLRNYLAYVESDGSPEGYLQYALLNLVGAQFYLAWQANDSAESVICSQSALQESIKWMQENLGPNSTDPASAAQFIPAATVQQTGSTVEVSLLVFNKLNGLARQTFTFNTGLPVKLLNTRREILVQYNGDPAF